MISRIISDFDASFTFNHAHEDFLCLRQGCTASACENHRQEKDVKKEKSNNINNLLSNYLPGPTFFTTACERRVKEVPVKEG
jgi:hypothetical protein